MEIKKERSNDTYSLSTLILPNMSSSSHFLHWRYFLSPLFPSIPSTLCLVSFQFSKHVKFFLLLLFSRWLSLLYLRWQTAKCTLPLLSPSLPSKKSKLFGFRRRTKWELYEGQVRAALMTIGQITKGRRGRKNGGPPHIPFEQKKKKYFKKKEEGPSRASSLYIYIYLWENRKLPTAPVVHAQIISLDALPISSGDDRGTSLTARQSTHRGNVYLILVGTEVILY